MVKRAYNTEEMKGLIIIPTYNERDNIERIIDEILKRVDVDILVVDDNSPDETWKVVEGIMVKNRNVHLIRREAKLGLGTAYITGFKYAMEKGYDFVGEMDADLSHNPAYLPSMIRELENYDMVIGSRYVEGGSVVNWPLLRRFLSVGANMYARLLTGVPVRDLTAGFVLYRTEVLKRIPLNKIRTDGYGFQIEIKYHVVKNGFKVKEIPITFVDRKVGKSKMDGKIIVQAFFLVLKLLYKRLKRRLL